MLSIFIIVDIFRKTRLKRILSGDSGSMPMFMSSEDVTDMICKKANLTEEERYLLEELNTIYTGTRMQRIFEDPEVLERWFTESRRVIHHHKDIDPSRKNNLSYAIYEIHRKITNTISLENLSIKRSIDISVGQKITMFLGKTSFEGVIIGNTFNNLSVSSNDPEIRKFSKTELINRALKINFWKVMDAGYNFQSHIKSVVVKENLYTLVIDAPSSTTCMQIREYPRKNTEIPVKFTKEEAPSQSIVDLKLKKNVKIEQQLGIMNNISVNGCCIVSRYPVNPQDFLIMEFPVFQKMLHLTGTVIYIRSYGLMKSIHIQFSNNTIKEDILQMYHFIFANPNSTE